MGSEKEGGHSPPFTEYYNLKGDWGRIGILKLEKCCRIGFLMNDYDLFYKRNHSLDAERIGDKNTVKYTYWIDVGR